MSAYQNCAKCDRKTRRKDLCQACHAWESAVITDDLGLGPGDWMLEGNVRVWVPGPPPVIVPPEPAKRGPKPMADTFEWTWPDLIEARRLFAIGERTPWVIEGNRVYRRETKRRQRATKTEQKEAA